MIICSPYINLSTATLFSFSILLTWTQCIWHRSFICTYILLLCDADVLSNQITYICHTHTVLYTLMVTISFYWNAYKAHILLLIDFSLSKLVNHTKYLEQNEQMVIINKSSTVIYLRSPGCPPYIHL